MGLLYVVLSRPGVIDNCCQLKLHVSRSSMSMTPVVSTIHHSALQLSPLVICKNIGHDAIAPLRPVNKNCRPIPS
eukprot:9901413-Lingulodinium_polyedra.AAC.1